MLRQTALRKFHIFLSLFFLLFSILIWKGFCFFLYKIRLPDAARVGLKSRGCIQKLWIQNYSQRFNNSSEIKNRLSIFWNSPKIKKEPYSFFCTELYQQLPLEGASSLLISSKQTAALKAHVAIWTNFRSSRLYALLYFQISY